MAETVWYILGGAAVLGALACIVQRNPVAAALCLVVTMFSLAGIYVLLNAQFIGVIQVLVYAGAIMVLFLFVIMLLNLGRETGDFRRWPAWGVAGAVLVAILTPLLLLARYTPARLAADVTHRAGAAWRDPGELLPGGREALEAVQARGVVGAIAEPLFQHYLVPFEITSVLLLTAAVGAVVLAKRKL
jgi:NADH-quinone oxidoreductase subunit J